MLHSVTNANVRWTVWQTQMHIWLFYVTNVIASARKFPLSDKCKFKYMSTFQRSHHSPPKGSGPRQIGPRNTNTNANANANTFQWSNHSPPKQVTDIVNETCWAVCCMLSYKLVCVYECVCVCVQMCATNWYKRRLQLYSQTWTIISSKLFSSLYLPSFDKFKSTISLQMCVCQS